MDNRSVACEIAKQAIEEGDPVGWFEQPYQLAETRPEVVAWADRKAR